MTWNWHHFFELTENVKKFKESIQAKQTYLDENVKSVFIEGEDHPQNLMYSTWSNKFFRLTYAQNLITIDKKYLLFIIDDYIKESEFYHIYKDKNSFQYVPYEFMLEMHLAKDSSSGKSRYNYLLNKLVDTLEIKSISIQGSPLIKTKTELDNFLLEN